MSALRIARTSLAATIVAYLGALGLGSAKLIDAEAAFLVSLLAVLAGAVSATVCFITQAIEYVRHRRAG